MRVLILKAPDESIEKILSDYFGDTIFDIKPGSRGHVAQTLHTAIWATLNAKDYSDGILNVISLGGDTDTNAMVAGTMLAALHPINQEWKKALRRKDIIDKAIEDFLE